MLLTKLKVLRGHAYQTIPDLDSVQLPATFRGRPELFAAGLDDRTLNELVVMCPTQALSGRPFSLDMGRCIFCGQCARVAPKNIKFTNDFRLACTSRSGLVVVADRPWKQTIEPREGLSVFRDSLRLREVCAGGDGAADIELDAAGNVNFDMRRYGIEFVASPRHADGVAFTGPITRRMASALEDTYRAVSDPKILVAVGADAISGGLFADSSAVDRSFLSLHTPDLYIPGHPSHPLTIINGLRLLLGQQCL